MNRDVCEHFNPVDLPCEKCAEKRKSEALFLADELTIPLGTVIGSEVHRRAAAELRRLHEAYECNTAIMHARTKRMNELLAEREVLLKALKYIYKELRRYGRQHWSEAVKAQAAIAKAEEKA